MTINSDMLRLLFANNNCLQRQLCQKNNIADQGAAMVVCFSVILVVDIAFQDRSLLLLEIYVIFCVNSLKEDF